ncbi:putative reverse transcriptase domain-containing protein [Tanacetum coccineum]
MLHQITTQFVHGARIRSMLGIVGNVVSVVSWSLDRKYVTCFNCNEKGRRKRDCPKLKKNGQGGNNRGAVYKLGDVDAHQDLKVITGTFLLNNRYATALFDSGANKSFVSISFSTLIDIEPVELDTCYEVELADGKVVETDIQEKDKKKSKNDKAKYENEKSVKRRKKSKPKSTPTKSSQSQSQPRQSQVKAKSIYNFRD